MTADAAALGSRDHLLPIPGLGGLGALAEVRRWRADPCNFFLRLCNTYGDVARFQLGPLRVVVLRGPEHIQHVLQRHHRRYDKSSRGYKVMRQVFGAGLLTAEGAAWKRQRRIVQPTFHRRAIEDLATAIDREALAMLDRWRGRDTIAAHDEMTEVTLRIVVRTLFGMDFDEDFARLSGALDGMTLALRDRIVHARLPWSIPTPRNKRQQKHIDVVGDIVAKLIARRRNAPAGSDLLSLLMEARTESGDALTDEQLSDEVLTLFLAGHDTTANTLAWTWYLLSRHPHVGARVYEEVSAVSGDGPLTMEQLQRMPYVDAVVAEVLRLYPPAWAIPRRALEDDDVGGFRIRRGDNVVAMPFCAHRHPDHWPNPEGFDPDRFADGPPTGESRFAYIPFGAGPRLCVGKALAELEAKIVIARVARSLRLDLVSGQLVGIRSAITLKPSTSLAMRLVRR